MTDERGRVAFTYRAPQGGGSETVWASVGDNDTTAERATFDLATYG